MTSGRPGEPGLPGEPGAPGTRGGGTGGTGGHGGGGGRGGSAPRHWLAVVAFVVLIAIGLSIGTLILAENVNDNTANIAQLTRTADAELAAQNRKQDEAINAARRAEYRICVRQVVTRAILILDEKREAHPAPDGLRLLDCTPNLKGEAAVPLTATQTRRFLQHAETASSLP